MTHSERDPGRSSDECDFYDDDPRQDPDYQRYEREVAARLAERDQTEELVDAACEYF